MHSLLIPAKETGSQSKDPDVSAREGIMLIPKEGESRAGLPNLGANYVSISSRAARTESSPQSKTTRESLLVEGMASQYENLSFVGTRIYAPPVSAMSLAEAQGDFSPTARWSTTWRDARGSASALSKVGDLSQHRH
jgi:hypothetical protein